MMRLTLRRFLQIAGTVAITAALPASMCAAYPRQGRLPPWQSWHNFANEIVRDGHRVIDRSDDRLITTSEGQAYALFFALADDDRKLFDGLWRWTAENLCAGTPSERLPAWLWGRIERENKTNFKEKSQIVEWGVIDDNNATDADLWIAYSLLEAGRLWKIDAYREAGRAILNLLWNTCVREVGTLGTVCLPGRFGYVDDRGSVTLNPSYYPLQVLKRFAHEDPAWLAVARGSLRAILRASPGGIAPDWAQFNAQGLRVNVGRNLGDWDAIRVYLWIGFLSEGDPDRTVLMNHFRTMRALVEARKALPGAADSQTLRVSGSGPDAFQAAFLAWAPDSAESAVARTLLRQLPIGSSNYFKSMLTLFGLGFDERRFAFTRDGRLVRPIRGTEFGVK